MLLLHQPKQGSFLPEFSKPSLSWLSSYISHERRDLPPAGNVLLWLAFLCYLQSQQHWLCRAPPHRNLIKFLWSHPWELCRASENFQRKIKQQVIKLTEMNKFPLSFVLSFCTTHITSPFLCRCRCSLCAWQGVQDPLCPLRTTSNLQAHARLCLSSL